MPINASLNENYKINDTLESIKNNDDFTVGDVHKIDQIKKPNEQPNSTPFEKYKSIIYNRKSEVSNDNSILYEKVFLYDDVKDKLRHNLLVMPKDSIDGVVYIWKFSKEDIMLKASKIKQRLKELNAPLDILITHEMPKINSGFADNFYNTRSSAVFGDALYMLKPKLAISGHLHGNKTLITKYEHGTLINLGAFTDGHYAIINVKDSRFEIDNIISVKILTL